MKTKMMMLLLALVSWGAYAQHDDKKMDETMAMFKDAKLGTAYEHYVRLKDALVASKNEDAQKIASELRKALAPLANGKKASDEAIKIANTSAIIDQRMAFSNLSNEMATLVKGGKLSMGTIYLEYCPMANNNTGAFWLSNDKKIRNPYFGMAMLSCGSVKETINK
jgi:hypothetical protein